MKDYLLAHGVPVDDIPLTPMTAQKILSGVYFSEDDLSLLQALPEVGLVVFSLPASKSRETDTTMEGSLLPFNLKHAELKICFAFIGQLLTAVLLSMRELPKSLPTLFLTPDMMVTLTATETM
jgi:hypothetical protein